MKTMIKAFWLLATLAAMASTEGCGRDGANGKDGQSITGPQGQQGAPGEDGASVTVVKLCPGNTSYPNTFVEVAFCIDGHLYATYSTHGGFTAEIVPGTYSSNAVNSSCTFTVGNNCEVTNQ
jgi:hypothetical protein